VVDGQRHVLPKTRKTVALKNYASMQDVQQKIHAILIEKLGIPDSQITPDASFVRDLGIDSLDYAELVMEFEQTFDIRIPDDDAEKMQTIGQAVAYIEAKIKK
jgi:acyl carrier protein